MIFDVDGLTSWLDFYILFIPEVRLFYQVLAETKELKISKLSPFADVHPLFSG
jgi:hypothetical protein